MKQMSHEQGVGLIEVLVAVLLLSVAVLGFSALQMRAIGATDESLVRTQALSIMRGLAENMRANPQQIDTYQTTINDATKTVASCTSCTAEQIAINQSKAAFNQLKGYDIGVKIVTCPGTSGFSEVKCIIAAWGDTKAKIDKLGDPDDADDAGDIDDNACADENGIYKSGSTCVIVEAY